MKINNVKVYDLEESIIASGYPMQVDLEEVQDEISNLVYWNKSSVLQLFIKNKALLDNIELKEDYATIHVKNSKNNTEGCFDIDFIDIELFLSNNWHISNNGYLKCEEGLFHRLILNVEDDLVVDHIDRNKNNNLRNNLRICTRQENTMNSGLSRNNITGVTGVSYRKDKNKWRAYIFLNGKQITLGHFSNFDEAVVARLLGEKEYFGDFAPQIHLFNEYGIEYDIKRKKNQLANLKKALDNYKRIIKLSGTPKGSGHDQALTGIRVNFDLTFTNKAWVELERYRFVEFISSQSTMHRIAKFNLREQYNKYVDTRMIDIMEELKDKYNETQDKEDYLTLLYSNPSGFELTARLTTNYRALKTVYSQRRNHRLPEWRLLCSWIETLPMAKELIVGEKV